METVGERPRKGVRDGMASAEHEKVKSPADGGWLTLGECSQELSAAFGKRIPRRTVLGWCHRAHNPLPHMRPGGRVYVHRSELWSYINRGSRMLDGAA